LSRRANKQNRETHTHERRSRSEFLWIVGDEVAAGRNGCNGGRLKRSSGFSGIDTFVAAIAWSISSKDCRCREAATL
jgi:predicted nucleic acid-binding protein